MRRTSCLHSLGLGLTFLSFAALPACQSSGASDPPAFVNPGGSSAAGDAALLASLEINPAEEPTADEQGGPGVGQDGALASNSEPDANAGRFGWVALAAIKIAAVDPHAPTGMFADKCAQKPDGTYCDEAAPSLGHVCRSHQIAGALQSPPPYTICSGPSPDGMSLVCHD